MLYEWTDIGPARIAIGDCLDVMRDIPDCSTDMILCDLPYGTTACNWDSVIPFEPLWNHYKRIIKRNGAIVLTASQPFTSALVMSNPKWFRYQWVWEKNVASNFLDVKRKPLKVHEDACVFYGNQPTYQPQMEQGNPYRSKRSGRDDTGDCYGTIGKRIDTVNKGQRYPKSVLRFSRETGLHPTQKPVALIEYLIRTYTNPDETVLDNCFGSGTTGVACINTGRKFIGIEKDERYFAIGRDRIRSVWEAAQTDLLNRVAAL